LPKRLPATKNDPQSRLGEDMKVSTVLKAGLNLSKLTLSLALVWVTLGWKVRRARKAFERELVTSGMPREAATRLGKNYSSVKDEVIRQLWSSARKSRF